MRKNCSIYDEYKSKKENVEQGIQRNDLHRYVEFDSDFDEL